MKTYVFTVNYLVNIFVLNFDVHNSNVLFNNCIVEETMRLSMFDESLDIGSWL